MNTIDMMMVMQAFVDGKRVEFREWGSGDKWHLMSCIDPVWDWETNEYRVKKEERVDEGEQFMRLSKEQVRQVVVTALLDTYHLEEDLANRIAIKKVLRVFGLFDNWPESGFGE